MIRFDNHAFKGLDESFRQVLELIQSMGMGVEELIGILSAALDNADAEMFAQAKAVDKTINRAETQVDTVVASMINKFTLIGEDLRFTLAAIKIAGTFERMADKIKNSTKRLSRVTQPLDAEVRSKLETAVEALRGMLPLALEQVTDYTAERAEAMLAQGATVQQAYRAILLYLHAHTAKADDETHLMLVAKNMEQAADMGIEIMKICHFVHTGNKFEKNSNAA